MEDYRFNEDFTFEICNDPGRDLTVEWANSIRVKVKKPLGEDEISRMLKGRKKK